MNYKNVRMKWTSGAACPEGLSLNDVCHLFKKDNKLYFSNGNLEMLTEEEAARNIFTPNEVSWSDVEFTDEVKQSKVKQNNYNGFLN